MVLFQGEVQKADTLIKAFYSAKKKGTPEAAAAALAIGEHFALIGQHIAGSGKHKEVLGWAARVAKGEAKAWTERRRPGLTAARLRLRLLTAPA